MKIKMAFNFMVFLVTAVTNETLSVNSITIYTKQLCQPWKANYQPSCNRHKFTLLLLRYPLILIKSEYWKLYD